MTAELEARLREAALHIRKLPSASMTGTTVALGVADGARIYHALTDAADALAASERDAGRYRQARTNFATGRHPCICDYEDDLLGDDLAAIDAAQEAEREAVSA